jgi:hypothetical protein
MTIAWFILGRDFLTGKHEADEIQEMTENGDILNSKMPSSWISLFHVFLLNFSAAREGHVPSRRLPAELLLPHVCATSSG